MVSVVLRLRRVDGRTDGRTDELDCVDVHLAGESNRADCSRERAAPVAFASPNLLSLACFAPEENSSISISVSVSVSVWLRWCRLDDAARTLIGLLAPDYKFASTSNRRHCHRYWLVAASVDTHPPDTITLSSIECVGIALGGCGSYACNHATVRPTLGAVLSPNRSRI